MKKVIVLIFISLVSLSIFCGEFSINEIINNPDILINIRIPRTLFSLFSGLSLAICGLLLQSFFQNPLAGPFVLGIHSGASIGILSWILFMGLFINISPLLIQNGLILASIAGTFIVLSLLLLMSRYFKNKSFLIIIGMLISYAGSSIMNVFTNVLDAKDLKNFMIWGLGNFERYGIGYAIFFGFVICLVLFFSLNRSNDLNKILLGENYARSLGVNIELNRRFLIIASSILGGVCLSFCGPLVFIGVISPHLTRLILNENHHKVLLIYSGLMGAIFSLSSSIIFTVSNGLIPINAFLGLLGAPILVYLLVKRKTGVVLG